MMPSNDNADLISEAAAMLDELTRLRREILRDVAGPHPVTLPVAWPAGRPPPGRHVQGGAGGQVATSDHEPFVQGGPEHLGNERLGERRRDLPDPRQPLPDVACHGACCTAFRKRRNVRMIMSARAAGCCRARRRYCHAPTAGMPAGCRSLAKARAARPAPASPGGRGRRLRL